MSGHPPTPPQPRSTYVEGCTVCEAVRERSGFGPPHRASDRCESGKRNHCTCNRCF